MGAFRSIIGCNLDQYTTGSFEPTRYLILDTQEKKNVTARAVIAQQPLQSGDTISDHMYREPVTFTISGKFSVNGKNWDDDSYNFMQKGDRLTNIQEVFEYIKDNGILCRITTIDEEDISTSRSGQGTTFTLKSNARTRFKTRDHMALKDITWVENQNTVEFTFGFSEVIMVEKQEYEELSDEDRENLGLPYVTSPQGSSLGTVLADTGQLDEIIIQSLYDHGYIDNDFLAALLEQVEFLKTMSLMAVNMLVTIAITYAIIKIGSLALAGVSSLLSAAGVAAGATASVFPVGTIVVAVAAVVVSIAVGLYNFFNWKKAQEKRKKVFKLINGDPIPDGQRLQNLLDDIEKSINKVKTNLTIYNITGNHRQTVTLTLGGEYYLINFDKNNADQDQPWTASVTDMAGTALNTVRHQWAPVSSFMDLNRNQNLWFKDKSKEYEAYLVNPSLSAMVNDEEGKLVNAKEILDSYTIWVSKGDVEKEIKKIKDSIDKAIKDEGFI